MTDYTALAVYDVRKYIWDQLQASGILNVQDYYADGFNTALVPLIPSQQLPEFNNLLPTATYIVYDYEILPTSEMWWMTHESLDLMVVSLYHDKINTILNFLFDLFRRYDESAKDLFKSSTLFSNNFEFKYTAVESVKAPTPFKNEGDRMVGHINIQYGYCRKLDSNGRFI